MPSQIDLFVDLPQRIAVMLQQRVRVVGDFDLVLVDSFFETCQSDGFSG